MTSLRCRSSVSSCGHQRATRLALPALSAGWGRNAIATLSALATAPSAGAVLDKPRYVMEPQNSIVPAPSLACIRVEETPADIEPAVPIFATLSDEVCRASTEALRAGLKALKAVGVWGVVVDVWWGAVEGQVPQQYEWQQHHTLFRVAREVGLRVRASFCFHGDEKHTMPTWVLQEGLVTPDIFYTDKEGNRNTECLSLGVDDVPVLKGRTAVQAYSELLASFAREFAPLLGNVICDVDIGLGPKGELRYPSTPPDSRWTFPGIGEFQCYDRFMLSSLGACAQQVRQPHWGLVGPHDAGSYCQWPHQTGFFHHQGSWQGEYGRFFMQWYSGLLERHADRLLGAAASVLGARGVRLHARLPLMHWWYSSAAHGAELTAGIFNTSERDGYLPLLLCLHKHGVRPTLTGGELRTSEQPGHALADPEGLQLQIRAGAAALQLPVCLSNSGPSFEPSALAELERKAFEPACSQGIELPPVDSLVLSKVGDTMFEEGNWQAFKEWVARMSERGDALAGRVAPAARQSAQRAPWQQQQGLVTGGEAAQQLLQTPQEPAARQAAVMV